MTTQKKTLTEAYLRTLSSEERERVERALHPHDTPFTRRFARSTVERWKEAADKEGLSDTAWMEKHLGAAADRALGRRS